MNLLRLLETADALDKLVDEGPDPFAGVHAFNLDVFFDAQYQPEEKGWFNEERRREFDAEHGCGTAACAAGYIARLPEFHRLGLYANKDGVPAFGNATGWDALERFYDVTADDNKAILPHWSTYGLYQAMTYLFGPGSYDESDHHNPKVVADRIRTYVAYKTSMADAKNVLDLVTE